MEPPQVSFCRIEKILHMYRFLVDPCTDNAKNYSYKYKIINIKNYKH